MRDSQVSCEADHRGEVEPWGYKGWVYGEWILKKGFETRWRKKARETRGEREMALADKVVADGLSSSSATSRTVGSIEGGERRR